MDGQCDKLPTTISVGGQLFYFGDARINLGYENQTEFRRIFGTDKRTECLLRQYLFYDLKKKNNVHFKSQSDKKDVVKILEKRKQQLKQSIEVSGNLTKNNNLTRYYNGIQTLIGEITHTVADPNREPYEECLNQKRLLDEIKADEEKAFRMLLELSWYLLHPDAVPSDIQCKWAEVVDKLNELQLGDAMKQIKLPNKFQKSKALNYFSKIDMGAFMKEPSHDGAIKAASTMLSTEKNTDAMKNRLEQIITLLSLKKYLKSPNLPTETNLNTMGKQLIANPLRGGSKGGAITQDADLLSSMKPLYDYFKVIYDPIYSDVETRLKKRNESVPILPHLLTLLHLCNCINPTIENKGFGIYHIKGAPKELIDFIREQLVNPKTTEEEKKAYSKQVYYLSKLRLPLLLDPSGRLPALITKIKVIPYLQFCISGVNLILPETMDKMKKVKTEETFAELNSLFPDNELFLLVTDSHDALPFENIYTKIPLNVYDVEYQAIDVKIDNVPSVPVKVKSITDNTILLGDLVDFKPNIAYHHGLLMLSILFLLRNRMSS